MRRQLSDSVQCAPRSLWIFERRTNKQIKDIILATGKLYLAASRDGSALERPSAADVESAIETLKTVESSEDLSDEFKAIYRSGPARAIVSEARVASLQRKKDQASLQELTSNHKTAADLASQIQAFKLQGDTLDASLVTLTFHIKTVTRLAAKVHAIRTKASEGFRKDNEVALQQISSNVAKSAQLLLDAKQTIVWLIIGEAALPFLKAVLERTGCELTSQPKVLDQLSSRAMLSALTKPSALNYQNLFDEAALATAEAQFDKLKGVVDTSRATVTSVEFQDEHQASPQDICSKAWRDLWSAIGESALKVVLLQRSC